MTNWIKTEYGGYSDTNQSVEWKDILDWQVNMFFYSCYLYYVLDNPKLSDDNFDAIVRVLEDRYDELPERRSEEHRLNSSHIPLSRMPSSA